MYLWNVLTVLHVLNKRYYPNIYAPYYVCGLLITRKNPTHNYKSSILYIQLILTPSSHPDHKLCG